MTIYADYSYYKDTFQGNCITEAEWPACAREASAYIDCVTYGRLKGHPERVSDDVKMAVCGVAEVMKRYGAGSSGVRPGLKSASNDGYSESYADASELQKNRKAELWEAAGFYLPLSHPLRYAGVCECW